MTLTLDKNNKSVWKQTELGTTSTAKYTISGTARVAGAYKGSIQYDAAVEANPDYQYTARFDANGGTFSDGKAHSITSKKDVSFGNEFPADNIVTRTGYTFAGWYTKPNDDGIQVTKDTKMPANVNGTTYYAHWKPNTYKVQFNAYTSGFSGTMSDQTLTYDKTAVLTNNAFTKEGYQLKGWAASQADANAGKVAYTNMNRIVRNLVQNPKADGSSTYQLYGVWSKAQDVSQLHIDLASHKHIWFTNHDEKYHWRECKICGAIDGERQKHTYTKSFWDSAKGAADCNNANHHHDICSVCGYDHIDDTGKAKHTWPSTWNDSTMSIHIKRCLVCQNSLQTEQHYYMKDGNKVYIDTDTSAAKCDVCGLTFPGYHSLFAIPVYYPTSSLAYNLCENDQWRLNGYTTTYKVSDVSEDGRSATITITSSLPSGYTLTKADDLSLRNSDYFESFHQVNHGISNNSVSWTADVTMKPGYIWSEGNSSGLRLNNWIEFTDPKGNSCRGYSPYYIPCNFKAPEISNVSAAANDADKSSAGWARDAVITTSGTDVYDSYVNLTITDSTGRKLVNNAAVPVNNGKWTFNSTVAIEAPASGATLTAKVTHPSNSLTASKDFTVSKVDGLPPELISNMPNESGKWAASREVTLEGTDKGSGLVRLDLDTKSSALLRTPQPEYSRTFTLTGDVYEDARHSAFLEDAAGNETEVGLNFGRFDNTAPHINGVNIANGGSVTVTADDINASLKRQYDAGTYTGPYTGSGVAKYAWIDTADPKMTVHEEKTNKFTLPNGDYLILAYDQVGNMSDPYHVSISNQ